jgi:hypothetical protein
MGLFGIKSDPQEGLIYKDFYGVKVFPDRIEYKIGIRSETIPINQVSSILQDQIFGTLVIETTGGHRYSIVTGHKKEVQQAIYKALSMNKSTDSSQFSVADEISKLNELRKEGILTKKEFDRKKAQILDK